MRYKSPNPVLSKPGAAGPQPTNSGAVFSSRTSANDQGVSAKKGTMVQSAQPLSRPSDWRQFEKVSDAKFDRHLRIKHLVEIGELGPEHIYEDCDKKVCGMGYPISKSGSYSPFACSAFCRIAQFRLEHGIVPVIADLFSQSQAEPMFVTIYDELEWIYDHELPKFEPRPVRRSIKRSLCALSESLGQPITAIGRISFDMGHDMFGNIVVRPHVRLIVAGASRDVLLTGLQRPFGKIGSGSNVMVDAWPVKDVGALRYLLRCEFDGFRSLAKQDHSYVVPRHGVRQSPIGV